MSNYSTSVHI